MKGRRLMDFKVSRSRIEVKAGDEPGTFTGLASTFGNVDLGGDIVQPGAFAASIRKSGGKVKLLLQHDTNRPIGLAAVWESAAGLNVKGKLTLATRDGQEAYALLREGVLDSMSIGYSTVKSSKGKGGTRLLEVIDLHEISVVTFPANTSAVVESVKREGADIIRMIKRLSQQSQELSRDLGQRSHDRAVARIVAAGERAMRTARRIVEGGR
jgi:HK97 family phage prohead protease